MDEYLGVSQIAELLGVSNQRAHQVVWTKGFPDPVVRIGRTHGWREQDIRTWQRDRERKRS